MSYRPFKAQKSSYNILKDIKRKHIRHGCETVTEEVNRGIQNELIIAFIIYVQFIYYNFKSDCSFIIFST